MLAITHGVLTIAPDNVVSTTSCTIGRKHTSHDVEHISIVRRRSKRRSSLALAQRLQHTDRCTMHITG